MSLLNDVRIGAQRPQLSHLPPLAVTSAGVEAVEFAESCGLILDDWQRWCVHNSLLERADGRWASFENCIIVPRQNGKNEIVAAIQLASIYLFGDRLLVHSAHRFDTAAEHFLRLRDLIESSDELRALLLPGERSWVTANGKEAIRFNTGQRILFKARSRGGGRGFSGDKIFLDEAYDLPPAAMGAMVPTLSTRPMAQIYYTSSSPHRDSTILHSLIRRAEQPSGEDRLFLAAWMNAVDVDPSSMDAAYAANPAMGIRISEEYVADERQMMLADRGMVTEYLRERLGVPDMPDGSQGVVNMAVWLGLVDQGSQIVGVPQLALELSPDRQFASFAAAGRRADQLVHVELVDRFVGTAGVVDRAVELWGRWRSPIVVDPAGPAGSLIPLLVERGVEVHETTVRELTQSFGVFVDAVVQQELRHLGQGPLDAAVAAVRRRQVGDAWAWARASESADVTPLLAATLALGQVPAARRPTLYVSVD